MAFVLRPYRRFHGMAFVVCLFSLSSMMWADPQPVQGEQPAA